MTTRLRDSTAVSPDELALSLPPWLAARIEPWRISSLWLRADGRVGATLRSTKAELPIRLALAGAELHVDVVGRVPARAAASFVRALRTRLDPEPRLRPWLGAAARLAGQLTDRRGTKSDPLAAWRAWPSEPCRPHHEVAALPPVELAALSRPARAALAIHALARGEILDGLSAWEDLGELPEAPRFVELHAELIARALLGQRARALALAERAEALAGDRVCAWLSLARAYEVLGARADALRAHARVVALRGSPWDQLRMARARGQFEAEVPVDVGRLPSDENRLAFTSEAAKILRSAGHYDELLALAEATLASLDRDPPAWLVCLAARLHLWRGEVDEARALLLTLDADACASGPARLLEAIAALLEGEVDAGLAALDALDALDDQAGVGLERLLWRAEALLARGRLDEAMTCVEDQILRENTLPAFVLKLHIRARRDDPVELRAALRSPTFLDGLVREVLPSLCDADELAAAKADPARFAGLTRALLDAMAGNRSAEATWCRTVDGARAPAARLVPIRRRPSGRDAAVEVLVGIRHRSPAEVLAGFEPVAEAYPLSPHPFTYRGELLIWLGRYDDALACFAAGDERAPTRWSFVGRAAAYELLGRSEDAERWTRAGIERFGELESATTHVYRGERLRLHGELDAAERDLDIALAAKPRRIGARINLALIDHARGRAEAWAAQLDRLRADAPAFLFEAGVRAGVEIEPADLRRCLELMVGNRSSFLHTLIDERDAFRVIPAPQQWIAEARLSLADYRDVVGRALADQLLAAE